MATKSKAETLSYEAIQQHGLLLVTVPVSVQVKVKVTLEQATKVQGWSICIALLFL